MISLDEQFIKTELEIEKMQAAGHVNALALEEIKKLIKPGVSTRDLDRTAETIIRDHGGIPTFKGYPGPYPYPATLTISINEEMVHGIPSGRELMEGDIVSVDCGTTLDGYIGDSAFTQGVGEIGEEGSRLIRVTRESLYKGIEQILPGKHLGDVSAAIQEHVENFGYHVPRQYTGHGVGRQMHEPPQVPNFGIPGQGLVLKKGMTIAIEPMVLVGTHKTRVLSDEWTVISADHSLTAHYEHSVAVTANGPLILTKVKEN
ncbi:MAG TPA: type I methionyl aminopeptidase [Chloroflexi bacterium]|nr:type I methionyl aminopeptidase [Chloroflexota bacterium]